MKIIARNSFVLILFLLTLPAVAQVDKEALSLSVSKAEELNNQKLKEYVWKRKSDVFAENQLKLTTLTEFSFAPDGKLVATLVDAESTIKKKPGLRGRAQANAIEDKAEYIQKALALAVSYTFMTKGELLDFFSKATVSEKDGLLEATATDVRVKGDRLLVRIDPKTNLFTYKEFSSLLGADKVDGKMTYEKFSNGINHQSTSSINLPAQKMNIEARNQDYTVRVK